MKIIKNQKILGITSKVILEDGKVYLAKVDTGADTSSIDEDLYKKLGERDIIEKIPVRSSLGRNMRNKVKLKIVIEGQEFEELFTIANRKELKFKVLIGCNILKKGDFHVYPNKKL